MQCQLKTAPAAFFVLSQTEAHVAGTGAFIPNVPVAKRPAAYVPPALRGARGLPMRSAARSNPFIGKSLEQIAVMCHILNSKVCLGSHHNCAFCIYFQPVSDIACPKRMSCCIHSEQTDRALKELSVVPTAWQE